jgi:hypothetical protein
VTAPVNPLTLNAHLCDRTRTGSTGPPGRSSPGRRRVLQLLGIEQAAKAASADCRLGPGNGAAGNRVYEVTVTLGAGGTDVYTRRAILGLEPASTLVSPAHAGQRTW